MKENNIIVGCDISKDKIDIALINKDSHNLLSEKTYSNNQKGYKNIISHCCIGNNSLHVVMESTGNYHIKFAEYLERNKIKLSIINPLTIKRFAQMKMIRLKTDKVDAKTIALYCLEQNPSGYKPLTKPQKEIKSLNTVVNNLIKQRTMTKNLLHSQKLLTNSNEESMKALERVLRTLNQQIDTLEKQIDILIKENYKDTYKNILSIKGIGPKTATGIIAYLGELTNFTSYKQIASYIGITPAIKESGKTIKKTIGITKQGNSTLRTLFYLAALSASKFNKSCKELYQRLLAKGKRKKTALIAVANKLIKQLFAIVKFNRTFNNNYNFLLVS